MYVYACKCAKYAYMHINYQKGIYTVNPQLILHSHTGIVAEFTSLDQVDGGSRPENVKGMLHCFEYLFGCLLHWCVSLCSQAIPSSPLGQEYLNIKFIRA